MTLYCALFTGGVRGMHAHCVPAIRKQVSVVYEKESHLLCGTHLSQVHVGWGSNINALTVGLYVRLVRRLRWWNVPSYYKIVNPGVPAPRAMMLKSTRESI